MDWTWEDLVNNVLELIIINTIDTMEDDDNYTIDDMSEMMTHEYEMMKENLDEDINRNWETAIEKAKGMMKI